MTLFKNQSVISDDCLFQAAGTEAASRTQQPDWFHTEASDEKLYVCNKDTVKSEGCFPPQHNLLGVNKPANIGLSHAHAHAHTQTHGRKQI